MSVDRKATGSAGSSTSTVSSFRRRVTCMGRFGSGPSPRFRSGNSRTSAKAALQRGENRRLKTACLFPFESSMSLVSTVSASSSQPRDQGLRSWQPGPGQAAEEAEAVDGDGEGVAEVGGAVRVLDGVAVGVGVALPPEAGVSVGVGGFADVDGEDDDETETDAEDEADGDGVAEATTADESGGIRFSIAHRAPPYNPIATPESAPIAPQCVELPERPRCRW